MFSTETRSENGFDIVVLKDHASGTSVEIIPACGAILHGFIIHHEGNTLNVIDHYKNKQEFDEAVEDKGFKSCKLSPFVCRMRRATYEFGEKKYTVNKFFLGTNAHHGLIYDAPFDIISQKATAEAASLELLYAYKATDSGYPFQYDCRVLYELKAGNRLTVTTFIKNNESAAIPVADGWHPYFTFGGSINELQLQFNSHETLEFDAELLPTGKKLPYDHFSRPTPIGTLHLDNSFMVDTDAPQPILRLRDLAKKLQLEISTDKSYPVLQLYTPEHRQSIAIENLSAAPDAFNNHIGLTVLQGGKEAVFSTTYALSAF
ncbi:MAG: aldose 1-epimerase [Ferruginibacter sp.]